MKDPMVALSVRQPWAWALVTGRKPLENRSWMTLYRGRVWIHAAKTAPDPNAIAWIRSHFPFSVPNAYPLYPLGALVGYVTLTDCLVSSDNVWYVPGNYAWMVSDAVALRAPVPMRGRQGLWTIEPGSF